MDELELINRLKQKDPQAQKIYYDTKAQIWKYFMMKHFKRLWLEDIEEIVNDMFINLFKDIDKLEVDSFRSLGCFCRVKLMRCTSRHLQKYFDHKITTNSPIEGTIHEEALTFEENPEKYIDIQIIKDILSYREQDDKDMQIFKFFLEDFRTVEIGRMFNMHHDLVKRSINRTLNQLKDRLNGE